VRRIAAATLSAVVLASLGGPAGAQGPDRQARSGDVEPAADEPGPQQALTQRIGVWRLDALGAIKPELVARLEALFRSELDRLSKHPLPSRRKMDTAVGKDKKLRDCTGEDGCLTTIGKKVGVDVMVTGSVAALGDSYILNVKAVDVATGKQLRRIASDPLRGSPDELIEAIRVAAYSLLAPDQLYGSVLILSDLIGAAVSLDGKPVGKTPLPAAVDKQPLGKHVLRVEATGYLPFTEEVDVRFQKSTRVVVRLATAEPATGTGPVDARRVDAPRPWYTSKWMYLGASAAAIAVGAVIGWQLGKDTVISCLPEMPDPRCDR
jgi:hypothetical protein